MAGRKPKQEEPLLTEDEFWDVIAFARAYSGMYSQTYLTPELVNARMRDMNLNPHAATEIELNTALQSPKQNEKQLQGFSQSFELTSMVYKRLMSYLSNMLSFDITYTSDVKPEDYNTPKYKKDLLIVEKILDKFQFKKEFGIVVREMLRNDAYFGVIRDTGNSYVLQELPSDYCKITGRWEGGFLFSFNMYWFIQPGVDLDMYPDFFKKKFGEIFKSSNTIHRYNPSLPPELRDKSSWIYWVDIPSDLGVCFKMTPELATRLPYFTALFSDLILQGLMRNLQRNANMAAASKMIIGQVPLLNKEIKATIKDSIAVSPELLGKFMALIKSAISEAIRVASAPLEDMQGISFDSENEIYDSYLKTTLASSGINTNLIFTSDVKPNAIETQLSLNVDEQLMTALYEQFNCFMNYFVNKFTRNFKFLFYFEGTDFFLNRQNRFDTVMTLFTNGIVLPQKIAAALGMKPSQLRKYMEESQSSDFMSLLTPPTLEQQKTMAEITAKNQMDLAEKQGETQQKLQKQNLEAQEKQQSQEGGKPASPGRPLKKDSELGESGMQTREQASNVGRGGKTPK